ncbi:MAG TPA: hypothetical protein VFW50_28630 [Streptosporangiaceae bacterium]|nr:hypothetical protein [Streptosporangiaceae bacterium]
MVTSGAVLAVTGPGAALGAGPPPPVPYNPVTGRYLAGEAKQIAAGESPWTGGCGPGAGPSVPPPAAWPAGFPGDPDRTGWVRTR